MVRIRRTVRERPEFPLEVFYDGACGVCISQVRRYGHKDRNGRLVFVDISRDDFRPEGYHLSRADFMDQVHAFDRQGRMYCGVEALWAIWQAFPSSSRYGFLGVLVSLPGIHRMAQLGYWCFARLRRWLP